MIVHTLVIHHSGGPRSQTPEAIAKYHTDPPPLGRGWVKVGYHWLIDEAGVRHVGRGTHEIGSHAPPNTGRLGVCVIGDNTRPEESWNEVQRESLRELVSACRIIWPGIMVVGHRDTKRTLCPGLEVRDVLAGFVT